MLALASLVSQQALVQLIWSKYEVKAIRVRAGASLHIATNSTARSRQLTL